MAVTIAQLWGALRQGDGVTAPTDPIYTILARLLATTETMVNRYANEAPEAIKDQAAIQIAAYLYRADPAGGRNLFRNALTQSGAAALLDLWRTPRLVSTAGDAQGTQRTSGGLTAEEARAIADEVARSLDYAHNISGDAHADIRLMHEEDIVPINESILMIQQAIAELDEGAATTLVPLQARFQDIMNGGVKLQLTKDAGQNWSDVPGLHNLGLALQHQVPQSITDWLNAGNRVPPANMAGGDLSDDGLLGAIPALSRVGGVYVANWHLLPSHLFVPDQPTGEAPEGSTRIEFDVVNNDRAKAWYYNNGWIPSYTFPDHRLHVFADGFNPTSAAGALIGNDGDYGFSRVGTALVAVFLKNNGVWGQIATFPVGGGGGQSQAQVDARIRLLVENFAEVSETTSYVPVGKALASGRNSNYAVFSNGTNLEGRQVPNWVWQNTPFPASRMGITPGASRVMISTATPSQPKWHTFNQTVSLLAPNIRSMLVSASDQISVDPNDANKLIVAGAVPTAAQLLPRFNSEQVELEDGVLNIIGGGSGEAVSGVTRVLHLENLSTNRAGNDDVHSFELPAMEVGERVEFLALIDVTTQGVPGHNIGPHWISVAQNGVIVSNAHGIITGERNFGRAGTGLDINHVRTNAVDGPAYTSYSSGTRTLYLHRPVLGTADSAVRYGLRLYALRYRGAPGSGSDDYNDLANRPFIEGDPRNDASADESKFYVHGTGIAKKIYKPLIYLGTDASWTTREYGQNDVAGGQTWRGYTNHYGDLAIGANGDVRCVRQDKRTFVYSTAGLEPTWLITSEVFQNNEIYTSEAAALRAHAHKYDTDDGGISDHYLWYDLAAGENWTDAKAYTITDYTAGTEAHTVWVPYEYDLESSIHALNARVNHVESDLLGGKTLWFGTKAQYDALTDAQKADATRVHFYPPS